MSRFACCACVVVLALFLGFADRMTADLGLPACAADFSGEVVLNDRVLDAMIAQAEPGGTRPDREQSMLFIVVKHYLKQSDALLVISRTAPAQPPVVLRHDCLPYPATASQVRAPFADLSTEQKQALVTYHDLTDPGIGQATTGVGSMAQAPASAMSQEKKQMAPVITHTIDIYEVTNAQYRQFITDKGYETETHWSDEGWAWAQQKQRRQPSYWENEQLNKPQQPVVGVSWYEADAYCRWAGKVLPTEALWDKACRGADERKFPWGNEPMMAESTDQESNPEQMGTAVVGSMPETQTPAGVHDLAGNTLEWTATTQTNGGYVLRGGSGKSTSAHVGCDVSHTLLPGMAANFIGFRCHAAASASQ